LEAGSHVAKSKSAVGGEISQYSNAISFAVEDKNVAAPTTTKKSSKGDFSGDGRINLVDFSILSFWYKRPSPPVKYDLNGDGKVDIRDFSIMASSWTG